MRTPSPRGLTPRIVEAISQRVEKIVSKRLKGSQRSSGIATSSSGISAEEREFVVNAVEYFLINQKSVTEPQLNDLGAVLSAQLAERREAQQRRHNNPAAGNANSILPPVQQLQYQQDYPPAQREPQQQTSSSPRLPPIASPRRPAPPPPAPSSVAPFATNNAIERSPRSSKHIAKSILSAALDEQLRQKDEHRKDVESKKRQDISERLAHVADDENSIEQQTILRKQINALMNDEYTHFARGRQLQEKIAKLELNLQNHLDKKRVTVEEQQHAQAQKSERHRRRSEERSGLEAQLLERERMAKQQQDEAQWGSAQFAIGTSPEEVKAAAEKRKKSLAQGLSEQIRLQQQRSAAASHDDKY